MPDKETLREVCMKKVLKVLWLIILVAVFFACDSSGSDTDDDTDDTNPHELDFGRIIWDGNVYDAGSSGISYYTTDFYVYEIYGVFDEPGFMVEVYDFPASGITAPVDADMNDDMLPTVVINTGNYVTTWISTSGTVTNESPEDPFVFTISFDVTMSNQGTLAPLSGYIVFGDE